MFNNLPENYLASGVATSHVATLIAKYSTAPAYTEKLNSIPGSVSDPDPNWIRI